MLSSSRFTRGAVILSGLWIACVYLWFSTQPNVGAPVVAYGVLPALLFGGGMWVWSGQRMPKDAHASVKPLASRAPAEAESAAPKPASAPMRLCARYTDIALCSLLAGFLASVPLPPDFLAIRLDDASHNLVIAGVVLSVIALGFVLDAFAYQCFGNTPGKALLGLRVLTRDGTALTAGQYWRRNGGVFAMGYCFGTPFLAWLPMLYNGRRLAKTGCTAWDAKWGYQVVQSPLFAWRVALFCVIFVVVQCLTYGGRFNRTPGPSAPAAPAAMASPTSPAAGQRAAQAPQPPATPIEETNPFAAIAARYSKQLSWVNPRTGLQAQIPDAWGKLAEFNNQITFFRTDGDKRTATGTLFFAPRKAGQTLRDYVRQRYAKAMIRIEIKERTAGSRLVLYVARDSANAGEPYFVDSEHWESREGFWDLSYGSPGVLNERTIAEPQELADDLMASTTP